MGLSNGCESKGSLLISIDELDLLSQDVIALIGLKTSFGYLTLLKVIIRRLFLCNDIIRNVKCSNYISVIYDSLNISWADRRTSWPVINNVIPTGEVMYLISPSARYKGEFAEFYNDLVVNDPENADYYEQGYSGFEDYIESLTNEAQGINLREGYVPCRHFWFGLVR